ncbi:hypothetical protein EVA_21477 [gut metagenome]|uniref:Uncharacterized protein n=1 Tax=gut metagenome TaxID=749906 RepID=J9FLB2_9ZZZZ
MIAAAKVRTFSLSPNLFEVFFRKDSSGRKPSCPMSNGWNIAWPCQPHPLSVITLIHHV